MRKSAQPSRTAPKLRDDAKLKPSPRPYTTYNVFFQLEREYILQHDLGVTPDFEEVFDPSDEGYEGPPLPPKYRDIVLSIDWHVPGKALRKKRKHRACHRKISFVDLSKNVSASWRDADDHVKLFCAQVSDISMMKYKREMYQFKKKDCSAEGKNKSHSSIRKSNTSSKPKRRVTPELRPNSVTCASTSGSNIFPQEITTSLLNLPANLYLSTVHSSTSVPVDATARVVAASVPTIRPQISTSSNLTVDRSNVFDMVDVRDDEIFGMWMSLDEPILVGTEKGSLAPAGASLPFSLPASTTFHHHHVNARGA